MLMVVYRLWTRRARKKIDNRRNKKMSVKNVRSLCVNQQPFLWLRCILRNFSSIERTYKYWYACTCVLAFMEFGCWFSFCTNSDLPKKIFTSSSFTECSQLYQYRKINSHVDWPTGWESLICSYFPGKQLKFTPDILLGHRKSFWNSQIFT